MFQLPGPHVMLTIIIAKQYKCGTGCIYPPLAAHKTILTNRLEFKAFDRRHSTRYPRIRLRRFKNGGVKFV